MKGFGQEFKEFIMRGNVIDLAVAVIIGGAFTAIVNGLVEGIIMPLISLLFGGISFDQWNFPLGAGEEAPVLALGTFITAVINFILVALVIFLLVKAINNARRKAEERKKAEEAAAPPTTKVCPYCLSEIPIEATKCAHCTSELPAAEAK